MAWFKVDDSFTDHPKVKAIPRSERRAAIGLWTLAGSYAARQLTNGFIFKDDVADLGCTAKDAAALVRSGLWHQRGHDCTECEPVGADQYLFHDWLTYQRSREQVLSERAKAAERQKKAREASAQREASRRDRGVTNAVTSPDVQGVVTAPPTRPDPTPSVVASSEDRYETLRAVPDSEPTCSRHPLGDAVGPCTGCARVRAWRDKNETAARDAAQRARENCPDCGGGVWLDDGTKCQHPKTRRTA